MIPKIIHRVHLGPSEPQMVKDAWSISQMVNSGWDHLTHNESSMENFPLCSPYINQSDKYSFKSDLMRFEALYNWGGVYIDTDIFCIKPFDSLLESNNVIVGLEDDKIIGSAVLVAPPKHPKILQILLSMIKSVRRESEQIGGYVYGPESGAFGPTATTRLWMQDSGVLKLSPDFFYPVHWTVEASLSNRDQETVDEYIQRIQGVITDNTYCSHRASASWKESYEKL